MKLPRKEISTAMKAYSAAQRILASIEAEFSILEADLRKQLESKTSGPMLARAQAAEQLQILAFHYYDGLFSDKKYLDTPHGRIGFRVHSPKVVKSHKLSWESVVAALAEKSPDLVRTKQEVDKARLIALRNEPAMRALLSDIGLSVIQDECFYIKEK